MSTFKNTIIAIGASSLLALFGVLTHSSELKAVGGSTVILQDTDGDGLDDLLEYRIGSNPELFDTDGDGVSDLQEIMVGTDFNLSTPVHSIPSSDTALYFNVYSLGSDFVAEVYILNHSGVAQFEMVRARTTDQVSFSMSQLSSLLVDVTTLPAYDSGWQIDRARFLLPASAFSGQDSMSLAAQVVADQAIMAQAVTLTSVTGVLAQLVWDNQSMMANGHTNTGAFSFGTGNTSGGGSGSNPRGGLFPTEPSSDGPPQSGTLDEVCLQVLQPIAYLGVGRVEYQVADAFCDPLAGAVCLTGCSSTLGDTIIGIDIVGLLGG